MPQWYVCREIMSSLFVWIYTYMDHCVLIFFVAVCSFAIPLSLPCIYWNAARQLFFCFFFIFCTAKKRKIIISIFICWWVQTQFLNEISCNSIENLFKSKSKRTNDRYACVEHIKMDNRNLYIKAVCVLCNSIRK